MALHLRGGDPAKAKEFFTNKMTFTTGPIEVDYYKKQGADFNIIDVRANEDYLEGHVPGAISLPEDEWGTLRGLSKDKVNVIYCYSVVCHLAAKAAVKFAGAGFQVMEMDGGFEEWKEHELEIEKGQPKAVA